MTDEPPAGPTGIRDVETAREWAADEATTPTLLAGIYDHWPQARPELAGNPKTPSYLLQRMAESNEPELWEAILHNPSAVALSIRPQMQSPWPPPTEVPAEPAPVGQAAQQVCPNPNCGARVRPGQVTCISCGYRLRSDITSVIPATAAEGQGTTAWESATDAEKTAIMTGAHAVRTVTPLGYTPQVATPIQQQQSAAAAKAAAAMSGGKVGEMDGADRRDRLRSGRATRVGPGGLLLVFGVIGIVVLLALVSQARSGLNNRTKVAAERKLVPKAPSSTTLALTTTAPPISIASGATIGTESPPTAAPAPTEPAAPAPEPTAAPDTPAPAPAPPATKAPTTTAKPAPKTTVAPTPTTLGVKSAGPSPADNAANVAALAQTYASALASKNADAVKAMNPSQSGDLSGYKALDSSTVIPVSVAGTADPFTLNMGLVAHEVTASSKRTVLYCAVWKINVGAHTVTPSSGRQLRAMTGLVDPATLASEIRKNCG